MKNSLQKAVFLDRDGVINVDNGYVHRPQQFEFIDGVFAACRRLQALGYQLIIVTNQSGIGRGYYSEHDFAALSRWMLQRFQDNQVRINAIYYCPYHPEHGKGRYRRASLYRKPQPQMLLDAAAEHQLDLTTSCLVGDKTSDLQAGIAAGVGQNFFIGDGGTLPVELQTIKHYASLSELVRMEFS